MMPVLTDVPVRDPSVAVAMAKCLVTRLWTADTPIAAEPRAFHPLPCRWCPYDAEDLRAAVVAFNAWAEYDPRTHTFGEPSARHWSRLPAREQAAEIRLAQYGLEDDAVAPREHDPWCNADPLHVGACQHPPDEEETR